MPSSASKTSSAPRSGKYGTLILAAAILPFSVSSAFAAGFAVTSDSSTAQTATNGTSGTVSAGVTLNVSGSTQAVTLSSGTGGSTTTLTNSGTITQSGTGRAVQSAGTNAVLVIQNNLGATIFTASNDTIAAGTGSTSVTAVSLTNAGTIESAAGGQAVNFNKIVNGGTNSVVNSGLIKATASDAVRTGLNGTVSNSGTIWAIAVAGSSSDGVDAQNNSGAQIANSGLIEGGRHGVTGGALNNAVTFTTSVTNNVGATIQGDNGSGINLDGFNALQTATIVNHGTITGNGITGDGDGIDVDGLVNISNTGIIRSLNAFSATTPAQSEGITVGGGTIVNSGTIEGLVSAGNTNAVGRGISLLGNDITTGPLAGTREAIYGNAVVTNQAGGLIRGQSDSGIAVDGPASGFTVVINNNAGATIIGGGTANATIRTGADNDTINNAGTIDGSSSGKAIDMGAGNNALYVTGGSASIIGNISGGVGGTNTMTINPGAGNSFAYAGSISNFNTVLIQSGTVTLSGVNAYAGTTRITGGQLIVAGSLSPSSSLELGGGKLQMLGTGDAGFAGFSLTDNSEMDLGSTTLTFASIGSIAAGKSLKIDFQTAASPDYLLRFLGDHSADADFLLLVSETTADGLAVSMRFDGTYTDISVAAVPEPETYAMLVAGLGLLAATRRRQQKARS